MRVRLILFCSTKTFGTENTLVQKGNNVLYCIIFYGVGYTYRYVVDIHILFYTRHVQIKFTYVYTCSFYI